MNELELIEELGAGFRLPDRSELADARNRLLMEIRRSDVLATTTADSRASEPNHSTRRLSKRGRIAVGLVAALMVAAGVTSVVVSSSSQQVLPSLKINLATAQFLRQAAAVALQQPGNPPQPGQFVYSETKDPSGTISRIWLSADGKQPGLTGSGQTIPICGASIVGCVGYLPDLSTNPGDVLSDLKQVDLISRNDIPGDARSNNDIGKVVNYLLQNVYLLPTQRAALYEFLAAIPGFIYVPNATDAIGRPGVGIGWSDPLGGGSAEIIFDSTTYSYLGIRTWPAASFTGPESPYDGSALITMAVVDSAGSVPVSP